LALYLRIEAALRGYIPLPDSPKPLGLFLASEESEDRVWNLIMPPWAFGVRTMKDRSTIVSHLYKDSDDEPTDDPMTRLRAPAEFVDDSLDEDDPLHRVRKTVEDHIGAHPNLEDMILLLNVLSDVINYEVRTILSAWYLTEKQLPASLELVDRIPPEVRSQQLGIYYDPFG
jgi:hypothetical protein